MILQRNELNILIQFYQVISLNYDYFDDIIKFSDKYSKSIFKSNLFNLVDIRSSLIAKNFSLVEEQYLSLVLFNDQKSIIKEVINFYINHPEINYDPTYGLVKFEEHNSDIAINNDLHSIQLLSDKIDSLSSNSYSTESFDYSKIEEIVKSNFSVKFLADLNKPFEMKLIGISDSLHNEIEKLKVILEHTSNKYLHHEEISKSILSNTVKNVSELQNKIHSEIHDTIAKANIVELKSFFSAIQNEVKCIKDESKIQRDRLARSNFYWTLSFIFIFFLGVVSTSFIMSDRTVKLLLELTHNSSTK